MLPPALSSTPRRVSWVLLPLLQQALPPGACEDAVFFVLPGAVQNKPTAHIISSSQHLCRGFSTTIRLLLPFCVLNWNLLLFNFFYSTSVLCRYAELLRRKNNPLSIWREGDFSPMLSNSLCVKGPKWTDSTRTSLTENLPVQNLQQGLPWWLGGKESTCQCRRHGFDPWRSHMPWSS